MPTVRAFLSTVVKVRETRASVSVEARFESGGHFKFVISRAGERVDSSLPCRLDLDQRAQAKRRLVAMTKARSGETSKMRVERVAALLRACASSTDLLSMVA